MISDKKNYKDSQLDGWILEDSSTEAAEAEKPRLIDPMLKGILLALFITKFIAVQCIVPTESMEPTLNTGSRYLCVKVSTYFGENKNLVHGDVVVFKAPQEHFSDFDGMLVKRVIGLPGDTIAMINGTVMRNGEAITEDYLKDGISMSYVGIAELIVPENELLVIGDNRLNSYDSRFWEGYTFSMDNVVGELLLFEK